VSRTFAIGLPDSSMTCPDTAAPSWSVILSSAGPFADATVVNIDVGAYPGADASTDTKPGCTGLIVALPDSSVLNVRSATSASLTSAPAIGFVAPSTTVTAIAAPSDSRTTTGSLFAVSLTVTGPPVIEPDIDHTR